LYQTFYKLKEHPFRLTPDPAFMCMTAQHREALSGLIYSVCTHSGLTVLVGEAGTGKTTLLFALLEMLEKRKYVTAVCNNPMLKREEFFDLLLMKLGIECDSPLKSRQLKALQDGLLKYRAEGRPAILIVDEAQRLPMELLEEIRLLLNVETPREKLLAIIMAGQPELSEIMGRQDLRQLKQRVSCLCSLKPLSAEEVREYIFHRLLRAGSQQSLFPEDVIDRISQYSQGIPRLVNSLCDSCLQLGFALQSPKVTVAIVEEAATDLDLIPKRAVVAATAPVVVPPPTAAPPPAPTQPSAPAWKPKAQESEAPPVPIAVAAAASEPRLNGNSHKVPEVRVPFESYANRQKSLGFLAGLMERWK
jgi:general secretion pathway protein A